MNNHSYSGRFLLRWRKILKPDYLCSIITTVKKSFEVNNNVMKHEEVNFLQLNDFEINFFNRLRHRRKVKRYRGSFNKVIIAARLVAQLMRWLRLAKRSVSISFAHLLY